MTALRSRVVRGLILYPPTGVPLRWSRAGSFLTADDVRELRTLELVGFVSCRRGEGFRLTAAGRAHATDLGLMDTGRTMVEDAGLADQSGFQPRFGEPVRRRKVVASATTTPEGMLF